MPEEIRFTQRCRRLVVDDGEVCRTTFGNLTQLQTKLPLSNRGVVLQKELRGFYKRNPRVMVGKPVQQIGTAHLSQHVRTHTVGAQSNQHAFIEQFQQRRDADRVIHIRFGVVDDTRPGRSQDVHLSLVDVNTMDENRLFACYA